MSPLLYALPVTAFLFSCAAGNETNLVIPSNGPLIVATSQEIDSINDKPFSDSLRAYFENPCDFYALKKKTEHMHSGGSIDLADKNFHTISNPEAILYHYWAIEFRPPAYPEYGLCFATWKPWKTAVQKYYETDNETLVGIHCKVQWEGLGKSNFVGMHIDSVKAKFGEPQGTDDRHSIYYNSTTLNRSDDQARPTHIYFIDDHFLLLHEENQHITWFKYYWWYENITSADVLPANVFEWSQ